VAIHFPSIPTNPGHSRSFTDQRKAFMTVLNSTATSDKNYFQKCLNPKTVQAARPICQAGKITEFRPIPQIAHDGSVLPMTMGSTPDGFDFSNIIIEPTVQNVGINEKFTGLARMIDRPGSDDISKIFTGMFIRLKGRLKRNQIPEALAQPVKALFEKNADGFSALDKRDYGLMQAVVITLNSETFEKPRPKQVLFLTSSAMNAVNGVLTDAHAAGIDVFDPLKGYTIVLSCLPADPRVGRQMDIFTAKLGRQIPLPVETCKKLWVPWDYAYLPGGPGELPAERAAREAENAERASKAALKLYTQREHLEQAIRCFGRAIVHCAFPTEVEDYERTLNAKPVAVQAPAPVAAKTATVASAAPAAPVMDIGTDLPEPIPDIDVPAAPPVVATPGQSKPLAQTSPDDMAAHFESLLKGG
jgi:hypothetical protein